MKIQYCSDLHLEFPANKRHLKINPLQPQGDILLLAGDIIPFVAMDTEQNFFDFVADHFEQTYWVPGNHEYYRSDIRERTGVVHEKIRTNVFLVNNYAVNFKNVRLLFSTLWSRISPAREWIIEKSLADFHAIRNNSYRLSVPAYNRLHDECKDFLMHELQHNAKQNTVVVTHHVPTFLNYPEKYKHSNLNEGFAVELFDLIEKSEAVCWIYGHHHQHVADFEIGRTKLVTNQLGYVEYGEHIHFSAEKTIVL